MSQEESRETTEEQPLFVQEMQWGEQPVRLTAWRCTSLPTDAPTTSVHIIALYGDRVLVVRDRRGTFGFPGGRLEAGETPTQALAREVHEEARAHLKADYRLFAILKIEYPVRLPSRNYLHSHTYMGVYAGAVKSLEPIGIDPAGIVTGRDLFTRTTCEKRLPSHDVILLEEALNALHTQPNFNWRGLRTFAAYGKPTDALPVRPTK